jgi:glycosyltransferase involved in cell wall biosynthesis
VLRREFVDGGSEQARRYSMRILMLIKTTGLVYDDRLRKEVTSLQRQGHHPEIAVLEGNNEPGFRRVYNQVPARSLRLHSRRWLPQARGLPLKTAELYLQFLMAVARARPDVVWVHNLELSGLVLLLAPLKRIGLFRYLVWDQHELPSDSLLRSTYFMRSFARVMNACDRIIMANEERRQLILDSLDGLLTAPIDVLENLADTTFSKLEKKTLPSEVSSWLGDEPYFLAQGGASPNRYLRELVDAVFVLGLRLIIVGPYQQHDIDYLQRMHGNDLCRRILFTGFVPQLEIVPFIDHALASIVLYDSHSENSRLCAPNRMYQALARSTPVIVGANPTMANVVDHYRCGVVLDTDGCDPLDIQAALKIAFIRQQDFRENAQCAREELLWERQEPILCDLLSHPVD